MLQAARSRVRVPLRSIFFFNLPNPFSHTMAQESTQPLTEISTRISPVAGEGGRRVRLTTLPPSVSRLSSEIVGTSTSHNPMGLHGLLQALPEIVLYHAASSFSLLKSEEIRARWATKYVICYGVVPHPFDSDPNFGLGYNPRPQQNITSI
jgi:hypothetical protein